MDIQTQETTVHIQRFFAMQGIPDQTLYIVENMSGAKQCMAGIGYLDSLLTKAEDMLYSADSTNNGSNALRTVKKIIDVFYIWQEEVQKHLPSLFNEGNHLLQTLGREIDAGTIAVFAVKNLEHRVNALENAIKKYENLNKPGLPSGANGRVGYV